MLKIRSILEDMNSSQVSNEGTFSLTTSDELQFDWRIPPSRLKICRHPDGGDWKLGSGGFGTVTFSAAPSIDVITQVCMRHNKSNSIGPASHNFRCLSNRSK